MNMKFMKTKNEWVIVSHSSEIFLSLLTFLQRNSGVSTSIRYESHRHDRNTLIMKMCHLNPKLSVYEVEEYIVSFGSKLYHIYD